MTHPSLLRARRVQSELWIFIAAAFASAFLIFLIQPMVGKRILPWFGGAPAVWTLCLAFYQSTLFLGYAYAHLLIRFVRPSHQLVLHAVMVATALVALPVLPNAAWAPEGAGDPIAGVLLILLANVALPFMVLAATAPLVQAWFARRYPSRSPYPLCAVSNFGSLLALLAYPAWIEPQLPLSHTGTLWSLAFAPTAVAVLGCAALARRPAQEAAVSEPAAGDERSAPPTPVAIALWLLLPGAAVVMLMAVTNKLCLDVASLPFLWILPLAAYLVTFILCFGSARTYRRVPYVALFAFGLFLTVGEPYWSVGLDPTGQTIERSLYVQIPTYCTLLFASCMILHGELYRMRPPARSLTAFYLCISGGGALGGLFVGLLAPVLFTSYLEFVLGPALVALLLLVTCLNDPASILSARAPAWRWAVVGPLTLGVLVLAGWQRLHPSVSLRHQERGFFGVLRVIQLDTDRGSQRQLWHGNTIHGVQLLADDSSRLPASYFGLATGVGLALGSRGPTDATRVGVIGLGVGTLAAYGRAGDLMRFYEIDPAVIGIARDSGEFTYLKDSEAEIELVLGDARVALAAEQARGARQDFDVLIVDAFNSDAVPIHLLTREAFEHYKAALAPEGLLAIHVSSRHFDLRPLVARMGLEVGLESVQVRTEDAPLYQSQAAWWVLLVRDEGQLGKLERDLERRHRALDLPPASIAITQTRRWDVMHVAVWTDDYSDLFSLMTRQW